MSGFLMHFNILQSTAHKWVCGQAFNSKDFSSSDVNKELFKKKKVNTVEKLGKLKIEATNPE